jgi:diguanylate cyclase (GGDEF)-like protein/PAS domain S-box-containing protein
MNNENSTKKELIKELTKQRFDLAELKESEAMLYAILNNSTTVIYVKDVDGKYILINKIYEKLFKVNRTEIEGKTDHDIFPKDAADAFRANDLDIIKRKSPIEFEEVVPHDDGNHTYISVKFPLYDTSGMVYAVCGISTDITERKQMEEELKESEEKFRSLAENTQDYIMRYDEDCRHLYENPAALRVSGMTAEDIIGKTHRDAGFDEELSDFWEEKIKAVFKTGKSSQSIFEWEGATGKVFLDWHLYPEFDESNHVKTVLGISRDITELKRMEENLKKLATRDELTQAYNRTIFEELLSKEIEKFSRYSHPFSILLLDVDYFKKINDTYGHDTGDKVLETMSSIFRVSIRGFDSLIRWGGEEFLLIAPATDLEKAGLLADRLRKIIENQSFDTAGKITISLGVASFRSDDNKNSIVKRADEALYVAKRNGRNRVEIST